MKKSTIDKHLINIRKQGQRPFTEQQTVRYNNILVSYINKLIEKKDREGFDKYWLPFQAAFDRLGQNYPLPSILPTKPLDAFLIVSEPRVPAPSEVELENLNLTEFFSTKMDYGQIAKILGDYDGKPENCDSFLLKIELADELTNEENKATLLKFLKTRLSGRALSVSKDKNTIAGVIAALRANCKSAETSATLLAKLSATKQDNTVKNFVTQVESRFDQLTSAYIAEGVPPETARNLAKDFAINALTEGVKSPETKIILKSGQFTSLTDAVTKLMKEEATDDTKKVFYFKNNNYQGKKNNKFRKQNNNWGYNNTQNGNGNWGQNNNNFRNNNSNKNWPKNNNPQNGKNFKNKNIRVTNDNPENNTGPQGGAQCFVPLGAVPSTSRN